MNFASGDLRIGIAGQSVWLMPERGAYWENESTLLIADPHWGKDATFRASGIPVPAGTTGDGLDRLAAMVRRAEPRRVVFLGDFLHARAGRSPEMFTSLLQWRSALPAVEMILVRGNHDRHAGDPPPALSVRCVSAPYQLPPFVLAHHPATSADGHVIAGHLHPAARLRGSGRQSIRLPCFVVGVRTTVLPAFGDFTGVAEIDPAPGERIYVVTADAVLSVTEGS